MLQELLIVQSYYDDTLTDVKILTIRLDVDDSFVYITYFNDLIETISRSSNNFYGDSTKFVDNIHSED